MFIKYSLQTSLQQTDCKISRQRKYQRYFWCKHHVKL